MPAWFKLGALSISIMAEILIALAAFNDSFKDVSLVAYMSICLLIYLLANSAGIA